MHTLEHLQILWGNWYPIFYGVYLGWLPAEYYYFPDSLLFLVKSTRLDLWDLFPDICGHVITHGHLIYHHL